MIGLLDCNNFYVSCERLFNTKLFNKPVVVLSNNDGCVISRSNEAKEFGIKMGEPFFKIIKKVRMLGISVYSSNYSLYGDISNRVMNIIKKDCPEIEIYSIDEAFINLYGIRKKEEFCFNLKNKIFKWTGIPVSIGIGKTKTLAKIANRVVKKKNEYKVKFKFDSVYQISSKEEVDYILKRTNVGDVWGIGRNLELFFKKKKINSAFDFVNVNENFARAEKGIFVQKTILELKGTQCYYLEKEIPRKSIRVSRSFGRKVHFYNELEYALVNYSQKASEKLRKYKLFCGSITVFLETSRYDSGYYNNSDTFIFIEPTIDSRVIWNKAKYLLGKIYVRNLKYNKIGIILSNLCEEKSIQKSLFNSSLKDKKNTITSESLMKVFDHINKKFGEGKIKISVGKAITSNRKRIRKINRYHNWLMRSDFCSPCYTTKWCDIPKVKIG